MAGEEYPLPTLPDPGPIITNPNVKPPRPANSWIIYRAWRLKQLPPVGPGQGRRNQAEVSTLLSALWRNEKTEIKDHFERLADEAKALHKSRYPNYRYQPKKKEEVQAQQPKKPSTSKSTRGASGQFSAVSSLPVERAGHPYPSSSRPSRQSVDRVPPSPPLSAASSPGASTSFSYELEPSPSGAAVDERSPSPESAPSDEPLILSQTSVEDVAVTASNVVVSTLDTIAHASDPALEFADMPNSENLIDTSGWDFSVANTLFQGDSWAPSAFINTNFDAQPTTFTFNVPLNTLPADNLLPCGHSENGPHLAACFLANEDVEDIISVSATPQSELEISLGILHGTFDNFADDTNIYSLHSSLLDVPDMPLYPQDMSSLSYTLEQDYLSFAAGTVTNNENNEIKELFSPPNPGDVYYFQGQENQGSSSQHNETNTYIPPSGASHSATRRVGGDWSGYAREDLYSASQFEVQAS